MTSSKAADHAPDLDVAIIGAGFAGIAMAHALRAMRGARFMVFEKSSRPGGTWRDNVYPGCACDIPAHLYSLSFAPNPAWSRMFASQPEILEYLDHVVADHDLARHIRLNTLVDRATWDDDAALWRLALATGEQISTRVLVSAMGVLHHAAFPDIPGLTAFKGRVLHTALWDKDHDLAGKRVAVIGTGASAIQIVPAIADTVASLAVFQRTPPWIVGKVDRPFDEETRDRFRRFPWTRRHLRNRLFWAHEKRATGFTRRNPKALAKTEALCRRLLEKQVPDPILRARLTPDYAVGCKRLIISSDYYPTFARPNVELVTEPIVRIDEAGVITADGRRRDVDTIVLGTGYDARRALAHVPIVGREGRSLQDTWDGNGMEAFLGTVVAGFPNLFIITGPNAGGGHNSQIFMIEAQVHYIMRAIRKLRSRRARRIEIRDERQKAFVADMDERMTRSVWQGGGCKSWFLDPKTGRNNLLWPSYSTDYWWRTRRVRSSDYRIER